MTFISIAGDDLVSYRGALVPAYARLYANKDFRTSEGIFIGKGSPTSDSGFYQQFTASLVASNIRIATGNAYATTNSTDHPDVTYSLVVYDANGAKIKTVATNLRIPPITPTTWADIQRFSSGAVIKYPPTFYDTQAIDAKFAGIVNGAVKASDVQVGVVKVSTTPADLTDPIAVGTNDARLGNATAAVKALVKLSVNPVDEPIAVGDNDPRMYITPSSFAPPIITNDNDELTVTEDAYRYNLTSNASHSISGFISALVPLSDGEKHVFYNAGANDIILRHEWGGALSSARFVNDTGQDITLEPGQQVSIEYHGTPVLRWFVSSGALATSKPITVGTAGYDTFSAALSAIGSDPGTVKFTEDITESTTRVIPANAQLDPQNGAKLVKSGSGSIEFQGIGLTNPVSQTAVFSGFSPADITFTGSTYPRRISSSLWADANWDARVKNAIGAFTSKDVTIVANPGGSLTAQIEVKAKQRLYLTAGNYLNAWAGADNAQIILNSDTELYGDGMGRTRIQESAAAGGKIKLIYSKEADTGGQNGINDNISVHDLTVYGDNVQQRPDGARSAVLLGNGKNLHIYRVEGYYVHGYLAYIGLFGDSGNFADTWSITDCVSRGTISQAIGTILGRNGIIGRNHFVDISPVISYVVDGVTNSTTTVTSASASFSSSQIGVLVRISKPGQTTFETDLASVTDAHTIVLSAPVPFTATGVSVEFITGNNTVIDIEPSVAGGYVENIQIIDNIIDGTYAQQNFNAMSINATSVMAAKDIRINGNIITGRDISDITFYPGDVSAVNDTITIIDHQLETGQLIQLITISGTPPAGLTNGQTYYAIKVDKDTLKFAAAYGYAKAGVIVGINDAGTGRHSFFPPGRLSGGMILVGARNAQVSNNLIQGSSQYGIAAANSSELDIRDNKLSMVNGGIHLTAVVESNVSSNIIRRPLGASGGSLENILEDEITGYTVNTNGTTVTLTVGSSPIKRWWAGRIVTINAVDYTVEAVKSPTVFTITASAGVQTGVALATKFSSNKYRDNEVATTTLSATGTSIEYSKYTDYRKKGTVTIDPASVAANTIVDQTFTLTGAAVGDSLILSPPTAGLTAGLLFHQAWVSATNTIKVRFENTTGAPIDEASATWFYTLIR